MCGFTGFFGSELDAHSAAQTLQHMADAIRLRGPDQDGYWLDQSVGLGFGHRRLSILDLTEAGRQPMWSASRRYVIIFNGEVYNFREMARELSSLGHTFHGGSDTEVLLAAFEQWGVDEATTKFIGMFAYAVWDTAEHALYLGRDRLGVKPLYYGWVGKTLVFGSELKALRCYPGFQGEIHRKALQSYLLYNYIPSPLSVYRGIWKLPPAHIAKISYRTRGSLQGEPLPSRPYWDLKRIIEDARANPLRGTESEILASAEELLRDAVAKRMIADVPLGAFLSGGIDSSLVVALMQQIHGRAVKTFSIGFTEASHNEADHARAVAEHIGTDHTELYVSHDDLLKTVPTMAHLYDEPFADSSQIPTYIVSKLARQSVTVSLSGDGGDEIFGGYVRYAMGSKVWNRSSRLPAPVRSALAGALSVFGPGGWDKVFEQLGPILPARAKFKEPGYKLQKLAMILRESTPEGVYRRLLSNGVDAAALSRDPGSAFDGWLAQELPANLNFVEKMMVWDLITYLPDDILAKLDRASMGVSLEAREPLLDHRLIEFSWRLPLNYKIREGTGKWILRELLYRYVPKTLLDRPKTGFSIPIATWLRGPLKEWSRDLLAPERLHQQGYFNAAAVNRLLTEHLSGRRNWSASLWGLLMFQAWHDALKEGGAQAVAPQPDTVSQIASGAVAQ